MTEDEAIRKVTDCQQGEEIRSYGGFITIVISIIIIVLLLVLFGRVDVFILVFVLCADFDEFARRLRITEFFHDYTSDYQSDPFQPRSLWTPPTDRDDALNAYLNTVKHDLFTTKPRRIRDNLPKAQRRALRLLKQRHDIVIKSADKGSATVIMDRKWYLEECYRQLNNPTFYEQQDTDRTDTIHKRVTEYVKRMLNDELIKKTNKQTIPITKGSQTRTLLYSP